MTQKDKKPKTEKKYACALCRKMFAQQWHFSNHLETTHQLAGTFSEKLKTMMEIKARFPCMFCKATFMTKRGVVRHATKKHTDKIEILKRLMEEIEEGNASNDRVSPFSVPTDEHETIVILIPKKMGFTIDEILGMEQ